MGSHGGVRGIERVTSATLAGHEALQKAPQASQENGARTTTPLLGRRLPFPVLVLALLRASHDAPTSASSGPTTGVAESLEDLMTGRCADLPDTGGQADAPVTQHDWRYSSEDSQRWQPKGHGSSESRPAHLVRSDRGSCMDSLSSAELASRRHPAATSAGQRMAPLAGVHYASLRGQQAAELVLERSLPDTLVARSTEGA